MLRLWRRGNNLSMKKVVMATVLIVIASVFGFYFLSSNKSDTVEGYLRIHIRANSNNDSDQNVKYAVKENVSKLLTDLIIDCKTANEAMAIVNDNLKTIDNVAETVLKNSGFSYGAKARLTQEHFPTRSYDSLTLQDGVYDALIINLGEGNGDNWWCVVYPPLCFKNNNGKTEIKSIIDMIRKK